MQGRGHADSFGLLEGCEGDGLAHKDRHVLHAVELDKEIALESLVFEHCEESTALSATQC